MKKFIYIILTSVLLSSCTNIFSEDFIDIAPDEDLYFEKIFGDYDLFKKFSDHNYSYVLGHYSQMYNAMQAGLSDECMNLKPEASTQIINSGAWSASSTGGAVRELTDPWIDTYKGLRKVNTVLENIDMVPNFPSSEIKSRFWGENYFLRAMLHFQIVKRFGGVPLATKVLSLGQDQVDLPRNTYEECIEHIVSDCDKAVGLLGVKYNESDNGRATIGAARALKARALLYAARPLNNPNNDKAKWEKARNAAADVIGMNAYSLHHDYKAVFHDVLTDEIILNRPRPAMNFEQGNTDNSHFFVRFIAPQGYSGWMGTVPSQNLVDMFEDSNGFPIDASNSVYEPQDPYNNRDPRLKEIILYDGRYWYNRTTEFHYEVDAAGKKTGAVGRDQGIKEKNESAYAIAKLWKESFQRGNGTRTHLNFIFFRYAEILLNFAEAQNEIGGPESSHNGLSVRAALTQVRQRVGHVPVPPSISGSLDDMRKRIWNERAIELSFEDHRWFDVLTWKKGVEYFGKPIRGMEIYKYPDGKKTYNVIDLSAKLSKPRVFKEHMHLYPLPQNEIDKSGVLKQNPGW